MSAGIRGSCVLLVIGLLAIPLLGAEIFEYRRGSPENGHIIPDVPFEKWLKRNFCGPACMSMVLRFWQADNAPGQEAIAEKIMDPRKKASFNSEMLAFPRKRELSGYSFRGDLDLVRELISRNIPLIVLTKPIGAVNKGHYRVLIGFDEDRNLIIFHDPYFGPRRAMKYRDFLKVWEMDGSLNNDRWTLAIASSHSALDTFQEVWGHPLTRVNLATAYYRRSEYEKSFREWEAVRDARPEDPYPLYSLGMVCYRMGRYEEASEHARRALDLDPNSSYAYDVLGLALFKQGKYMESLKTLSQALGGEPRADFIKSHYLQVRAHYIEKASKRKEGK